MPATAPVAAPVAAVPRHRARPRSAPRTLGAVEDGDVLDRYLADLKSIPQLKWPEQRRLAERMRDGDTAARDELIRVNARFVISVAKKFQHRGVDLPDLIAAGNLGLCRAADRFDLEAGVRFISYAVWWVRQAIQDLLAEQGRPVRVPRNQAQNLARVARAQAVVREREGREPTVAEIAETCGLSADVALGLLGLAQAPCSLDAPVGDGTAERADALGMRLRVDEIQAGSTEDDGMQGLATLFLRGDIARAFELLDPRDARVLRLHYGFEDGRDPMNLEEVGRELGITRERVRQLRERALARLRQPDALRLLVALAA